MKNVIIEKNTVFTYKKYTHIYISKLYLSFYDNIYV